MIQLRRICAMVSVMVAIASLILYDDNSPNAPQPVSSVLALVMGIAAAAMATPPSCRKKDVLVLTAASTIGGIVLSNVVWVVFDNGDQHVVSEPTLICYALLTIACWLRGVWRSVAWPIWISRVAGLLAAVAFLGYTININVLYSWHREPISLVSAICIMLSAFAVNGRESSVASCNKSGEFGCAQHRGA